MKLLNVFSITICVLSFFYTHESYADECTVPNNRLINGSCEILNRSGNLTGWTFESDRSGDTFTREQGYQICDRYYGLITKGQGSSARVYQEVDVTPGAISIYFSGWGGVHAPCGAEFRLILLRSNGTEVSRQTVKVEKNVSTGRAPYLQKYELVSILPSNVKKVRVEAVMNKSSRENGDYLKIENLVVTFQEDSHLPVELTSFSAIAEGDVALLKWQTSSEENASEFEVEHSADGKTWNRIGIVKSAGAPSVAKNYQFIHTAPLRSNNYYRLRMVDNDATFEFSPIKSLLFSGSVASYMYPNPNRGELNFNSAPRKVTVFDATGRPVSVFENLSSGSKIDLRALPEGRYLVRWTDATGGENVQRLQLAR